MRPPIPTYSFGLRRFSPFESDTERLELSAPCLEREIYPPTPRSEATVRAVTTGDIAELAVDRRDRALLVDAAATSPLGYSETVSPDAPWGMVRRRFTAPHSVKSQRTPLRLTCRPAESRLICWMEVPVR